MGLMDPPSSSKRNQIHKKNQVCQMTNFLEDVVNRIKASVILEEFQLSSGEGNVPQVTERRGNKEIKDKVSRHPFKKYDRPKKDRAHRVIHHVYALILLSENLNSEHLLIYQVKYLAA